MEHNILVITDDENSKIVRTLLKQKIFPVIRRSIPTAMQILRHLKVTGIIVEDEHKSVDTLEFILNVRDITKDVPIFISNRYQKHSVIKQIKNYGQIVIFDETDNKIEKKIKRLVKHN
jgi:two-component SAPR family response regulator